MGMAGKLGNIYMKTTATATATTGEAMTNSGDNTTYYITDTSKRYWDKNSTVTVYVDATPETSVEIDCVGGRVKFDTPLTGVEVVTVDASYWTVSALAGFYNWNLDSSRDMLDATTFASNGWRVFVAGLGSFIVSAESFWQDEKFLDRLGEEVVVALYVNEASDIRYEGFAKIDSDSISNPVDELVEESVNFTGDGELYYYEV